MEERSVEIFIPEERSLGLVLCEGISVADTGVVGKKHEWAVPVGLQGCRQLPTTQC